MFKYNNKTTLFLRADFRRNSICASEAETMGVVRAYCLCISADWNDHQYFFPFIVITLGKGEIYKSFNHFKTSEHGEVDN